MVAALLFETDCGHMMQPQGPVSRIKRRGHVVITAYLNNCCRAPDPSCWCTIILLSTHERSGIMTPRDDLLDAETALVRGVRRMILH